MTPQGKHQAGELIAGRRHRPGCLADLEAKLQIAVEHILDGEVTDVAEEELLRSCLRDVKAMQGG